MTVEQTRTLELLGTDVSRELALTLDEMFARIEVLEAEHRSDGAERRRLRALMRGMAEHNEVLHRENANLAARLRLLECPNPEPLVQSGAYDPRD